MSTADPSTESISNSSGTAFVCSFCYHKVLQSFFALSYLYRGADPESIPSHTKPHTARSSLAGMAGMRSTQTRWYRLSMFHCRLPRERTEKKDVLIPNALMQQDSPALIKGDIFASFWHKRLRICIFQGLPPETSWSLKPVVTIQRYFPDKAWQCLYNKPVGSYKQKHSVQQRRQSSDRVQPLAEIT